jgi:hypothetical protein
MEHYNNCIKAGSEEMTVGGVMKRIINDNVVDIVVPNQVMIFINHVEMLKRSLCAEIPKFSIIAIKANKFETRRRKLNKNYQQKKHQIMNVISSSSTFINEDTGYSAYDFALHQGKRRLKQINEKYNFLLLDLYQEVLFPTLTELLAKLNYFEEEGVMM